MLQGEEKMEEIKDTVGEVLNIFKNGWNKQVILYGPPGTSKTYSATEIAAKFLAGNENDDGDLGDWAEKIRDSKRNGDGEFHKLCEKYLENNPRFKVIQFHPSYSYEDFVRGIAVNTKDENGKPLQTPSYEVKRKIIETFGDAEPKGEPKVLIIDEINRAPLGSVLGELIYGLEYRGKAVYTPYRYVDDETKKEIPLKVSENLYIIGTMNTADRSIGTMDYAVRRRFAFVPVLPNAEVIKDSWNNEKVGEEAERLFGEIDGLFSNEYLEDESIDVNDIKIGHTYFLGNKDNGMNTVDEISYLEYRVKYQILPVYQEYVKDGLIKKEGLDKFKEIFKPYLKK